MSGRNTSQVQMVADYVEPWATMRVQADRHVASDTLFMVVDGIADIPQLIDFVETEMRRFPANNTIMDIRACDVTEISLDDLKLLSASGARSEQFRTNPRSAVVIDVNSQGVLARLYEAVNVADKRNLKLGAFPDVQTALDWLQIVDPPAGWLDQG